MEYEVTVRVKVDASFFYWDLTTPDRQEVMVDTIRNAIHDLDEVKVIDTRVEELEV